MTQKDFIGILNALIFAARKHRDQRRKDEVASPYINHPIELAVVLAKEAGITDPTVLTAALLHDTVEDTQTTESELLQFFGSRITAIVMELTDDDSLPKSERKRLQIENAAQASFEARLVTLADKICNLRDMHTNPPASWDVKRRREYFDWAGKVVDGLRGTHGELERLFDQAYQNRPD